MTGTPQLDSLPKHLEYAAEELVGIKKQLINAVAEQNRLAAERDEARAVADRLEALYREERDDWSYQAYQRREEYYHSYNGFKPEFNAETEAAIAAARRES